MEIDYDKITDIEWGSIHFDDYPDFSDAHIVSAKHNGVDMNEEELESLDPTWVHYKLFNTLF
jgi:hypothetical protein